MARVVWTQVTASVQRNATGEPAYCIAIVQDISDRKRLEAELSQAHARLELAVRGSNVRIWDVDMPDGDFQNGRMYTVNFWEHLGYGPETQAETRTALSLLHPDDLEPAMRAVQAALSGEARGFEAEFRVRHNDGTYRWMLSRGAAVRNAAGIPVRFTGSDVDITDLKHAEAALRESEQRFRTFVDHASDAFFLLDQRMKVLDVNRRACQSLGYTRDELVGMTPTHLDADITPADLEDIERRLNVGESVAFESRHRRKDGTVFPVEIRAQAFSEGDRHFTVALARDVTDRKRAEEALRLSEQRYRSLVEATAAVVWTMAASGLAESEQPSWSAFTGQSTDQLAGWGWLDAIHPDDRAHTFEDWSTAVATRSLYQVEYRVRRRDGEYRNMLTRGVPILAGDGEIREWFGTCVDITDLKRAEEAVRESEERFRGTFENAAVGIAHKDVTGRFLRVNEKFCDIVGYTRDELLTRTWQDITYPDDVAACLEQYSPLMRGESLSFSLEKRYLRKDHSLVWVDVSVSLQRDAAGLPAYAIAMVQDISERKRLEDELRQAKEGAEAANRAKDEFLANVSHEIRTPMNAILGMTELALDTPLTDDQRQYLKTVKSAADSLLGLINDLLDFSKIEAGKLELDLADFSLRAVLGDTLRALAVRAHKKGLELISYVQSGVPDALVGDAGRLRQSLLNLVGNAIKFTEEGEVVVRVEVASDSVPDGEVGLHFTVTDTGIGIPPEKQETIFRAFEQEDTSTTRQVRRHRVGPDDCIPAGGLDGREDHRGQSAGAGQHLWFYGAVRSPAAPAGAGRLSTGSASQPARASCGRQRHQPPYLGGVATRLADGAGGGGRRVGRTERPLARHQLGPAVPADATRRAHARHGRAGTGRQAARAQRALLHAHYPVDFGGPPRRPGPVAPTGDQRQPAQAGPAGGAARDDLPGDEPDQRRRDRGRPVCAVSGAYPRSGSKPEATTHPDRRGQRIQRATPGTAAGPWAPQRAAGEQRSSGAGLARNRRSDFRGRFFDNSWSVSLELTGQGPFRNFRFRPPPP